MAEAFRNGGWGMYPVLVFGILFLGSTIWYAMTPERRRLLVPAVLSLVTLTSGMLGFLTGVMTSLMYAADQPQMLKFVALGTAESLNCICFALAWNVLGGLVIAAGAFRAGRQKSEPEQLARPAGAHG